jgi:hypothetical protein
MVDSLQIRVRVVTDMPHAFYNQFESPMTMILIALSAFIKVSPMMRNQNFCLIICLVSQPPSESDVLVSIGVIYDPPYATPCVLLFYVIPSACIIRTCQCMYYPMHRKVLTF